ncbi:MAG TPA: hypothetical protein DCL54_16125 [Alphaproteobacteria bacterium]|nr:hypothetical protein [Alphaproteobacteria bacterium]HAJ48100.1 hypothetical protein [Alphaproteobacteria bacterium]
MDLFRRQPPGTGSRRSQTGVLQGHILIASPGAEDPMIEKAVCFVVSHNNHGAMGLLVNKPVANISFVDLLKQLSIHTRVEAQVPVQFGGPRETARGFVLHSIDYSGQDATVGVINGVNLTTTVDILRDIAEGRGPKQAMVALGYLSWPSGVLEREMGDNLWQHCTPDEFLLYSPDFAAKWTHAIRKLGCDPSQFSRHSGRA